MVWVAMSAEAHFIALPVVGDAAARRPRWRAAQSLGLRGLSEPVQITIMLAVEFGLMIVVSSSSLNLSRFLAMRLAHFTPGCTRPWARKTRFAGTNHLVTCPNPPHWEWKGRCSIITSRRAGSHGRLQRLGLEIPRMTWFDWGGFLAAWVLVGCLIALFGIWLATLR